MEISTMAAIIAKQAEKQNDNKYANIKMLAEGYLIETWNKAIDAAHTTVSKTTPPYADNILKLKKE